MRRNGVDAPSHPLDSSCDQNAATTWIQGKRGSGTIGSTTRCGTYPLETRKTDLLKALERIVERAAIYFTRAATALADVVSPERWERPPADFFWQRLPEDLRAEASSIVAEVREFASEI